MNHVTNIDAAHQYIPATLDAGKDDSGAFVVPNAKPGAVGSISLQPFTGVPFNATTCLSATAGDLSEGVYRSIMHTFYYQLEGGTPREGCEQVAAGTRMFVNASLAHGSKLGKGPKDFSYYHRPAQ